MTNLTKLRRDWGTVWTTARRKTHLMPDCPYVTDTFTQRDISVLPDSHVDLCGWCEERYDNWTTGLAESTTDQCQRCGQALDRDYEHCPDCEEHITRMRARR